MKHPRPLGLRVLPVLVGLVAARESSAVDLTSDRLAFLPLQTETGPGTVRLQGMGGLEISVADENLEMNILDFSGNPAGFGDDRDAWSLDARFSHKELIERDATVSDGNDVSVNDGSILIGYHAPGRRGFGGRLDYSDVSASLTGGSANTLRLSGLELLGNLYIARRVSVGLNLGYAGDQDRVFSSDIYTISHKGKISKAGGGIGVIVAPGVTLGARGEAVSSRYDGESRGPYHTDAFTWDRPGGLWSVHAAVDRSRLQAAADYTAETLQGDESVDLSWSELFILNPTDQAYFNTVRTMSEDQSKKSLRARARVAVMDHMSVSGAMVRGDTDLDVRGNPTFLGSRRPHVLDAKDRAYLAGVSYQALQNRLLLALEVKLVDQEIRDTLEDSVRVDSQDGWITRLGGEFLISEVLIGRAGLRHQQMDLLLESHQPYGHPYGHNDQVTSVTAGLGIVPAGGIWQFDVSYEVAVKSDIDTDRSRFGAYIRHLF